MGFLARGDTDLVRSDDEIAEGSLLTDVNSSCNLFNLGLGCCYVPLHIVRKLAGEMILVEIGGFGQGFCR